MLLLGRDLRHGLRLFWKSPGVTLVSLVALALGMGAASAIFSVADAVLLKPLGFREAERLLVVWEKNPAQNMFKIFVATGNFLAWRSQSRVFESIGAFQDVHVNLSGGPNGPMDVEELAAQRVSAGLFPLLGVQPLVGRGFSPEEDQPGRTYFALLSYSLWQRRFSGDRSIAGQTIRLRDRSYTVLGVLPPGVQILDRAADVWIPLGLDSNDTGTLRGRFLTVIGRLRPGATPRQAEAELDTIGGRLEQADPALNRGWLPELVPMREELTGSVRQPLLILMGAVGLLLLIACVNVANLLLARGAARGKEFAVRTVLGAGRGRIILQLLAESLTLAAAGGILGLVLAWGGTGLLTRLGSATIPRLAEARLDWRVFLFALAVSAVTGVLFGLTPALQFATANPRAALIEGGRGSTAARSSRLLRNGLVVCEIALALLVLIGAGLLMRSFVRLRAVDPGFQPSHLLTLRLPLSPSAPIDGRAALLNRLSGRIAALPGVRSVGAVDTLPLTGLGGGTTFAVDGRPAPPPGQRPIGLVRGVTPEYFRTMAIPLVSGRFFTESDTAQSPPRIIVNQALARRFWPQANPIGGRLVLDPEGRIAEIAGVVGDVKSERLDADDWPTIYRPYPQTNFNIMVMVVRTAVAPEALASSVERAVHQSAPDQPVSAVRPMDAVVSQAVATARFHTLVLAVFAVIAFLLAASGIYGVVAYDVSRRTSEIGIRISLGAQPRDVLRLILGQCARLAALGIALGLAGAFALTRLMESMLFGVKPTDAYTFAVISLLLACVALAAGYLPSRRAMALHPAAALRHE
ncbi:MAG: ABC transporter permease [Bryobacteraceae bacterium]